MELDCELIRDGLVGQPISTVSSLAFVVAAFWVGRRNLLGALALVLAGVGSMVFHSAETPWAWIHELGLAALVAATGAAIWMHRRTVNPVGLALLAVGVVAWMLGRTGGPLCDPDSVLQAHAGWHVLAAWGCGLLLVGTRAPR